MRVIDISKPQERWIIMAYGDLRSGKTHFAATWERPLFFSDPTENGFTTIGSMDPSWFYDPKVKPQVWAWDQFSDLPGMIQKALPLVQKGEVKTIVIDSATYLSEMLLAELSTRYNDTRKLYADMGNKLRELRLAVHRLPCNVVWLCHDQPPDEQNPTGRPQIPGKQAKGFAGACDFILYLRSEVVTKGKDSRVTYEMRTLRYGAFIAGGRYRLPNPLPTTTARDFLAHVAAAPRVAFNVDEVFDESEPEQTEEGAADADASPPGDDAGRELPMSRKAAPAATPSRPTAPARPAPGPTAARPIASTARPAPTKR